MASHRIGDKPLTHWGRVTHICVSKLTIIGSDNGLPPGRRQAIIWTNAGILLIEPLGTNFNEILIEFHTFSFKKMHLKLSSGKCRPSCLGLNVLTEKWRPITFTHAYTPPTKSLWTVAPARNPWQASYWKADLSRTKHRRMLKFWMILYHMVL